MKVANISSKKFSVLCLLAIFSWGIASCGDAATQERKPPSDIPPFNYSLLLDSNGKLVVRGEKGEVLRSRPAHFPEEASAIVDVQTFTVVRAVGSHYILVNNQGTWTKYYLAH